MTHRDLEFSVHQRQEKLPLSLGSLERLDAQQNRPSAITNGDHDRMP